MYSIVIPSDCIRVDVPPYQLYKYPSEKKHNPDYSLVRSVIYKQDRLVCFSPPKSISYESFQSQYPINQTTIELFVDGTMINAFYDEEWKLATKSVIGAVCTFESTVSFADLFKECLDAEHIDYSQLNPLYCYSFVMQHPKNQIVLPVQSPKLWLVSVYEIIDGRVEERPIPFLQPPRYAFDTYEEAYWSVQNNTCKGYMLKSNGVRSKIRNDRYNALAILRGNVPFGYKYLCVRNTPDALTHFASFPEDKERASQIEEDILTGGQRLLEEYKSCFIRKSITHSESSMKSYLYDLHGIYLNEIRPRSMYKKRVLDYLNTLPPTRLSYLLKLTKP
jgi:hypothetical protein